MKSLTWFKRMLTLFPSKLSLCVSIFVALIGQAQGQNPAVNLARYQPLTSTRAYQQGEAVDGIVHNASWWRADSSTSNPWIEVDLQGEFAVGSAQVFLGNGTFAPCSNVRVQYWDGAAWQTCPGADITGNAERSLNIIFLSIVSASRFRLYLAGGGQDAVVREFALYPDNGGSGYSLGTDINLNLASHAGIDASNFAVGKYPRYAVDGYIHPEAQYVTDGTAGPHTLDTKMLWTQKVASVHLHSGSGPESALSDFDLLYWDGAAWQPCPGGSVSGNTDEHCIVNFSSPVTTSRIRLSFAGAGHIDEIVVLPDNGGVNYPSNTSVTTGAPPAMEWMLYEDSWYELVNRSNSKALTATPGGASQDDGTATADEKSYQLLYNYDTRDYRIRSKDSGDCLAIEDASTTVGANVIESAYTAAIHQRWLLEDAGSGFVRIVNRWSGLALASDGAVPAGVTQQTPGANALQEWQPVYLTHYPKKGSAGNSLAGTLNEAWNYGWTTDITDLGKDNTDYPMQWGEKTSEPHTDLHRDYSKWQSVSETMLLMAYNEPTHTDQANLTAEEGAEYFPVLAQMDLPIIGPSMAASGSGIGQWHDVWYNQYMKPQGYDFEYLGLHVYRNASVDTWINEIREFSELFENKKVVISEMNASIWGAGTWSEEDTYSAWAEFMYRAESLDFIRGYSAYAFWDSTMPGSPWEVGNWHGCMVLSGKFTELGNLYKAWDGDLNVYTNKSYMLHNLGCGSRVANVDSDSTPDGLPIRMASDPLTQYHSADVQWALFNAPGGKYYIVSTVDGTRLSYNGSTVSLAPVDTYGPDAEWTLTEYQYGEYFIESHAHNFDRLRLNRTSTSPLTYVVDTTPQSDTSESARFRFILSVEPATVPSENPPPPRADTDATKSQVKIPGTVQKGTLVTVTILAADSAGTLHKSGGAATWSVEVTGTNAYGFIPVTDHGNGSYTATYIATRNGVDTLDVQLNGAEVGTGNPYTVTVQDAPPPILTTLPAIVMSTTEARLSCLLDASGTANLTVFWGDNDGGTTPGSWDQSVDLGAKYSGNLSYDLTGLAPSSTSYFTFRATNANGTTWGLTKSFSTALTYNELLDTVDVNYNASSWTDGIPTPDDNLLSNTGGRLEVDWDHLYGSSFTINNHLTRFRAEGGNYTPGWLHIGGSGGIIWNGTANLWTAFESTGSAAGNTLFVEAFAFRNNNTGANPVIFKTAVDDKINLQLDTIGSGEDMVFYGQAGSSGYRITGNVNVKNSVGNIGTGDGFGSILDIQTTGSITPTGSIFVRDGTIDMNASNVIGDDVVISLEDSAGADATFDVSGATDNVGDLHCSGSGGILAVDGTTNYVFGDYNEGPIAITGFVAGNTVIQFDGVSGTESLGNMTINSGPATWSDIGGGVYQLGETTNWAPSATDVTISGILSVGNTLTGNYVYTDTEADPDASTFQWYRSADGVLDPNDTAIVGATGMTYTLQTEDLGCYLFFEVTPRAATGTSPGLKMLSVASDIIVSTPANNSPVIESVPWADTNPLTLPDTTNVNVSASDADSDPLTYTWSKTSGPGTVTFTPNATELSDVSNAAFSEAGTYVLSVTVSDSIDSVSDEVTVEVLPANTTPVVDAGPDQEVLLSSGTPWTPADISTIAWYDPSETSTISATGNAVNTLADKNGVYDLVDAGAGTEPTTGTRKINNLNVLDCDGGDYLQNTSFPVPASGDIAVFMVSEVDVIDKDYDSMFSMDASNDFQFDSNNMSQFDAQIRVNNIGSSAGATGGPFAGASIYNCNFDKSGAGIYNAYIDGIQRVADTIYTTNLDTTQAFRVFTSRDTQWKPDGAFGEIIITSDLTEATRLKIEGYLAHKWGLVDSLPLGHPYKGYAPGAANKIVNLDGSGTHDPDDDDLTYEWTLISSDPADQTATFSDPSAISPTVIFTQTGTYTLRLTADDGFGPVSDDVIITVNPATVTVTFQTDGTTGSSLTGETSQIVAYNGSCNLVSAVAPTGYHFVNWTNGVTEYSTNADLTVNNVTETMTLTANFAAGDTPHSADTIEPYWKISETEVNNFITAYNSNNSSSDPANGNIDTGRITMREVMRVIYLYNGSDTAGYIGGQGSGTVDGYEIEGAPPAQGAPQSAAPEASTENGTADTGDGSLVVSTTADSGAGSLRDAIAMTADGETITIDDSLDTIIILSEIVIDKSITIDGQGVAIVSGDKMTRIFRVENAERDINVTLKSIGIVDAENSADEFGGAVYNNAQTLTLDTVLFDGNTNTTENGKGGAAYSSGTLNVENCVFTDNIASEENDIYSDNGDIN